MFSPALRKAAVRFLALGLALLGALFVLAPAASARSLAVLDFELVDTTLTPEPAQIERTRQLAPLLRKALAERGAELLDIPAETAAAADRGVGYLFEHPELAAALARSSGAKLIAVCRHDRPTNLFSYLRVRLVDAERGLVIGNFTVEIKGQFDVTAPRGASRLAEDILAKLGSEK